jgi:formylglycine-generating enzyme required for sulfatase activity
MSSRLILYVPVTDPKGANEQNPEWRVMRGGNWANIPDICTSGNRGYFHPYQGWDIFSFRVVQETAT